MFKYNYSDIDWFCFINGCPIHVASNGGQLPSNLYTADGLLNTFKVVQKTTPHFNWAINETFISTRTNAYNYLKEANEKIQREHLLPTFINHEDYKGMPIKQLAYSWSFIEMAKRGFFSFDRVKGNNYRLVAYPTNIPLHNISKNKKSFCFTHDAIHHIYPFLSDISYHQILSMTRHLFTTKTLTISLSENIDLIRIINSIIKSS